MTPAGGDVHCREKDTVRRNTPRKKRGRREGVRKRRKRRKETLHPGYLLGA